MSLLGVCLAVLVLSVILLLVFPSEGGLINQVRQLSWLQLALAISVIMIELGFYFCIVLDGISVPAT